LKRILSSLLPFGLAAQTAPAPQPVAEAATIKIGILHGDDDVHTVGTRTSKALTVEVTDESGRPVDDAIVHFRLPSTGPAGLFSNGLNNDLVITGPDGRATAPRIRWNDTPGPLQIRVTAAKGDVRAGIIIRQHLSESHVSGSASTDSFSYPEPHRKWVKVTMIVAGVAAGSVAAGLAIGRRSSPAQGTAPGTATLSVGTPVITIGGPK
jgi:hypothetical protein